MKIPIHHFTVDPLACPMKASDEANCAACVHSKEINIFNRTGKAKGLGNIECKYTEHFTKTLKQSKKQETAFIAHPNEL